jgi:hypothetical protein
MTAKQKQEITNAILISLASLCIAKELTSLDSDKERKKRKENVVAKKMEALSRIMAEEDIATLHDLNIRPTLMKLTLKMPADELKAIAIDLAFGNPFTPYEIAYKESDLRIALSAIADPLGLNEAVIDSIWKTRKEALDAHNEISWAKIVMFSVGGAAVLAVGGWVAAPAVAAYLGAGAGLAGAAAVAHGLALLGGGSLALGGLGMAGGMWLVTGVGAVAGLTLGGGGAVLIQLGASASRIELVKVQISFKEITLSGQIDRAKSQAVIKNLEASRRELEKKLAEEQRLNDKNSSRISEIEKIIATMDKSIDWMKKKRDAA